MRSRLSLLAASALALLIGGFAGPAGAADYVTVSGAGSTWSQVAVDAWRVDMKRFGVVVNYAGTGSTDGRAQFRYGTVDFAVSEIPFQDHPEDGTAPEVSPRPFAYLPIVAGGTSFMYHLNIGGRRVTDLRLSGDTITKIFTGTITSWADPQITRDYGRQLPNVRIVPVVRSDGSGTTAQFTRYMATRYSSIWGPFCSRYKHLNPCGQVSFYPDAPSFKRQNGSNGVANYVAASYGEGAITYVEYAYAKNLGFPVAKVLNSAGYYTAPTASNVAVALTKAAINSDLTQNLDGVYANADRRTYPLSSYSYMIVPTDTKTPFSAEKGRTLSTFINYFLCAGQQKADVLGYSPLPTNLVQAGFNVVKRIPGFVAPPAISSCSNPALSVLQSASYPTACDKAGTANPCTVSGGKATSPQSTGGTQSGGTTGTTRSAGTTTPGRTATSGGTRSGGTTGTTSSAGGGGTTGTTNPGAAAATVDPDTGLPVAATDAGGGALLGTPVAVESSRTVGNTSVLGGLAALELLLVVLVPPIVAAALRRGRGVSR